MRYSFSQLLSERCLSSAVMSGFQIRNELAFFLNGKCEVEHGPIKEGVTWCGREYACLSTVWSRLFSLRCICASGCRVALTRLSRWCFPCSFGPACAGEYCSLVT